MMNNPPHLPDALIIAILARVPSKSMIRFRCVCKAWNSYIHEPYFLQLRQSTNHNKNHFFFVCPNPSNWGDEFSNPHVFLGQLPIHKDQAHLELNNSTHIISTMPNFLCSEIDVQFVNGFLCFHPKLYKPFCTFAQALFNTPIICNPTTRQIVTIPEDSAIDFDSYDNEILIMTHFGYDPNQDKFKVLRLIMDEYEFELKILEVGDYVWRDITHVVPYSLWSYIGPLIEFSGTCINGAIHWVDCDNKVLRAFDVGFEQFREIPIPDRLEIEKFGGAMHDGVDRLNSLKLMELGGNLCLVTYKDINHIDLSTLKDYQNQVWIHQEITIPDIPENIKYLNSIKMRYFPICRVNTEEILLLPHYVRYSPIRVQYYDEKKRRCRGGLIKGFPIIFFTELNSCGMRLFLYQENFKIL